jgi:thymidine kinase
MAKLYFRYGTVGSAKTHILLAVAHNYRAQGKKVLLMKPELDTRFGKAPIRSRSGLEKDADVLISHEMVIADLCYDHVTCILVDEAQFLSCRHVDEFREISARLNIPVICYGLRTDFRRCLFEGSRRLLEIADSIEEIKSTCHYCNRKAIFNMRHVNGAASLDGPVVQLGAEESYYPVCYSCYSTHTNPSLIIEHHF